MKRHATRTGGAAVAIAVLAAAAWYARQSISAAGSAAIPTARIQRGAVQVKVFTTGELRAARSAQMIAPPIGGTLQVVELAQSGDWVNSGDTVVEFDTAEQAFNLEQARFDFDQAQQNIAKADAQNAVQAAEDELGLVHARFEVRRAELDASGNELISAVDAKKNDLLLEEARHQLAQLEQDVQRHRESSGAAVAVLREKRNKADLSVQVAQRNIDNLRIRAPFDGFVMLRENTNAFGGPLFFGMAIPEYRAGDSVYSGQTLADVVDTSRIEVTAKVPEVDRANVNTGQPIDVAVDAVPGLSLHGSVRAVSNVASRSSPFMNDVVRQFDVLFDVTDAGHRIRPGFTTQIAIAGATLKDALYVPRQAIFESSGRSVVYVRTGSGFDAREVKVRARTDSLAVVENVESGLEVALVDPRSPSGSRPKPAAAPASQRAAR
ncbi:MAG TPA: efflux RND transporter periplasmic adaptor subunit [Vicinamibacterales bacterium]|nr:efflux RND transporter periplasmic adaptor subunit [Vicinamibacterales bacterium]